MSGRQVKLARAEKGSILYHYTKSNGINGIINHNCFWATKSDFLNDPNEFSHPFMPEKKKRENILSSLSQNAGTALQCGRNSEIKPDTI